MSDHVLTEARQSCRLTLRKRGIGTSWSRILILNVRSHGGILRRPPPANESLWDPMLRRQFWAAEDNYEGDAPRVLVRLYEAMRALKHLPRTLQRPMALSSVGLVAVILLASWYADDTPSGGVAPRSRSLNGSPARLRASATNRYRDTRCRPSTCRACSFNRSHGCLAGRATIRTSISRHAMAPAPSLLRCC